VGLVVFEAEGYCLGDILGFVFILNDYLAFWSETFDLHYRTLANESFGRFNLLLITIILNDLDKIDFVGRDCQWYVHNKVDELGVVLVEMCLF